MADRSSASGRRGRPKGSATFPWRAFFHQSDRPLFVLGPDRRIRFVNAAWERLTGMKQADALGTVCTTRGQASKLAAALCPPAEAQAGRIDHHRIPDPTTSRNAPPWWDVTFIPLTGPEGILGYMGAITVVGQSEPASARKVPPVIGQLRHRIAQHYTLDVLRGPSRFAQDLLVKARFAAHVHAPLWIQGEAGTGKATLARIIHTLSPQRERAFVRIEASALQPYLIEGLFFGHGGLTASEHIGTLYVAQPQHLPRDLQDRLLEECLAPRPGAPRLICGSSGERGEDVRGGRLDARFASEAAALEIHLLPLRLRREDIAHLSARILERRFPKPPPVDTEAVAVLSAQPWPGNIRELSEVLIAAAREHPSESLRAEHLPHAMRVRAGLPSTSSRPPRLGREAILQDVERRLIQLALRRSGYNRTLAAEILEMPRAELYRRMKALGLDTNTSELSERGEATP